MLPKEGFDGGQMQLMIPHKTDGLWPLPIFPLPMEPSRAMSPRLLACLLACSLDSLRLVVCALAISANPKEIDDGVLMPNPHAASPDE